MSSAEARASWRCSAKNGFKSRLRSADYGFESPCRSADHGFESPCRSADHGFTLIEMLVALAIFGLAALALLRLEGATVSGASRVADATVAQIVARNLAVGLLTDPQAPPIGAASGTAINDGRSWRWTRDVARTDDARIVRIDLAVTEPDGRPVTRLSLARAQ